MEFNELMNGINNLWQMIGPLVKSIVIAVLIWVIGFKLVGYLDKFMEKVFEKTSIDESVEKFLLSFVNIAAKVLIIITVIKALGVPTTALITLLGTFAMTIGLALQGSLSNFAGGLLILLFKPFRVGDYIVEDSHKNEGVVQSIDILYTKILTVDNKLVVVPNGTLANTSLTNVTAEKIRRVDINVGISYKSDLSKAKEVLTGVINKNNKILKDKEKSVFVKDLEDSRVLMETRVWVNGADYWEVMWQLKEGYKIELDKAGIEIPFNQLEVSMKNNK